MTDFIPPPLPTPDQADIFVPDGIDATHCPLCLGKWTLVEEEEKDGKAYFACFKSTCLISIWVRDPMLGKYFNYDKIPCAVCGKDMRLFFRSDQYMKCYCPGCKVVVEHVDEKKHQLMVEEEVRRGIRWRQDVKPK